MFFLFALDPAPSANAVKEGPWGIAVFVFLLVATVFLLWSMTRQLRKAKRANEEGILPSQDDTTSDVTATPTLHDTPHHP